MRRRRNVLLGGALLLLAIAMLALRTNSASANPLAGIVAVSAGEEHTCAITDAGGVKCWGRDFFGELGDGRRYPQNSSTPIAVQGLPAPIVSLASGYEHTCALTDAGDALCWGNGSTPTQVMANVTALGAGGENTCVVVETGAVDCWTNGYYGQLPSAPTSGAVSVSLSEDHACALMVGGGVKCWGRNQFGQLGDGTATDRLSPVDVVGLTNAVAIAAGNTFSCALTDARGVKCWGDRYGNFPADVSGLTSGVAAVSSSYIHTCALLDAGGVKCWGANSFGQLGDAQRCSATACVDPVDVAGLQSGVSALAVGGFHTCAVLIAGGVKCWGNNFEGQLGNGQSGPRLFSTTPVDVVEAFSKPTPTQELCPPGSCPTATPPPAPPRTGLDFSIAIDADGDGVDECTTHEEHRAECRLSPGSAFTVRVDLNALPRDMPVYVGFDATLISAGVQSTRKSIALWPDCGYPASYHEEHLDLFGCAAPINGSSTFVGPLGESHFTCTRNGSVTLLHGGGNTDLDANGDDIRAEASRGSETLTVTCGDLVRGDVDCDVHVNSVDVEDLLQKEAMLLEFLGCPQQSDVNLDNRTNVVDAAITLQYTAGLVDVLPPHAASLR
jgi:alpha-tubulin suppressor-like RCC1 family protein